MKHTREGIIMKHVTDIMGSAFLMSPSLMDSMHAKIMKQDTMSPVTDNTGFLKPLYLSSFICFSSCSVISISPISENESKIFQHMTFVFHSL